MKSQAVKGIIRAKNRKGRNMDLVHKIASGGCGCAIVAIIIIFVIVAAKSGM